MAGSEGSKYYDIFLKYNVWLKNLDRNEIVKTEQIELLRCIYKFNSLKNAAKELGISYRKAWDSINSAQNALGFELVIKSRGGKGGGESRLTEEGENLINAYEELISEFESATKRITKKFFKKINTDD